MPTLPNGDVSMPRSSSRPVTFEAYRDLALRKAFNEVRAVQDALEAPPRAVIVSREEIAGQRLVCFRRCVVQLSSGPGHPGGRKSRQSSYWRGMSIVWSSPGRCSMAKHTVMAP